MQKGIYQIKDTSDKKPFDNDIPNGRQKKLAQPSLDGVLKSSFVNAVIIHYHKYE